MKKMVSVLLSSALVCAMAGCVQSPGAQLAELAAEQQASEEAEVQTPTEVETTPAPQSGLQEQAPKPTPVLTGTYYTRELLMDREISANVFSAFVPQGWTASVASDWTYMSPERPGLESITIASPDGLAQIDIASRMDFVQHPYGQQGQDFSTYTTYLDYLDAGGFIDLYVNNTYGSSATLVNELPDDPDTMAQLQEYLNTIVTKANQSAATLTGGGSVGNTTITSEPYATSMCRRQYQVGGQYVETTAVDVAYTATFDNPVLTQTYTYWHVPYSIVYSAASEDAFEEYYEEYEVVVANSYFTQDYYAAEEYIASMLAAAAMDAKNAAINDGKSFFSDSGYTSADGESTNEKLINMWDDVINEVDSYTTLDGDTVKVSTEFDRVAQSGDEYYVGPSTSDIPDGFTELEKKGWN